MQFLLREFFFVMQSNTSVQTFLFFRFRFLEDK